MVSTLYTWQEGVMFHNGEYLEYMDHIVTKSRTLREQGKSSDIEQLPPFGDRKYSNALPQKRGGGIQNQREHHII